MCLCKILTYYITQLTNSVCDLITTSLFCLIIICCGLTPRLSFTGIIVVIYLKNLLYKMCVNMSKIYILFSLEQYHYNYLQYFLTVLMMLLMVVR